MKNIILHLVCTCAMFSLRSGYKLRVFDLINLLVYGLIIISGFLLSRAYKFFVNTALFLFISLNLKKCMPVTFMIYVVEFAILDYENLPRKGL